MRSTKAASRLLVAAMVAVLGACAAGLPHRWVDPVRGIEFRSDFEEQWVRQIYDQNLATRIDRLAALFDAPSLQGLRVCVHDQASVQVGAATLAGWHGGGEIHVMATLLPGLPFPSFESPRTFYHELVHALVQRAGLAFPRWFEEGVCEVLSASPLDRGGALVPFPDGQREAAARRLLAEGRLLAGPRLLACVDAYPDDEGEIEAMYAQGTSFVWFLLEGHLPSRALLAGLAGQPRERLLARYAAWERALPDTSVAALFAAALAVDDPAVREAAVRELADAPRDAEFWRAFAPRLVDANPRVRSAALLTALYQPPDDGATRRQLLAWRDGDDAGLRTAGNLGLAQLGDGQAVRDFLREAAEPKPGGAGGSWVLQLTWIRLLLPRGGVGIAPSIDSGPAGERAFAAALLQQFEVQQSDLVWRPDRRVFARRE